MSTTTTLDADEKCEHVDQEEYRSMIGSLLYLTVMRPDIQFLVCLCGRFQASPSTYLGICDILPTSAFGTPRLVLWRFMDFLTQILPSVSWIGSPLLGLASFWVPLWCLGLAAYSQVLLDPLLRQSMCS
jgi:hypothetical protein